MGYIGTRSLWHVLLLGTGGRWSGANSPIDPWQHGHEGGAERGDRKDIGPLHRETAWLSK